MTTVATSTKDAALALVRVAEEPGITVPELAALLDIQPKSLSASMSTWYRRADGDWGYVHREAITGRRGPTTYRYYFSKAVLRSPVDTSAPTEVQWGDDPPSVIYAKVIHEDEDGTVILMDSTGAVIKGRRLT